MFLQIIVVSVALATIPGSGNISSFGAEPKGEVHVTSLALNQQLQLDGAARVMRNMSLVLGGWNTFDLGSDTFIRGGYLGLRYRFLSTDVYRLSAAIRGVLAEPWDGVLRVPKVKKDVEGGIAVDADSLIRVMSFLEVVPDFNFTWLPSQSTARLASEVRVAIQGFRIGVQAGVQLWVVAGEVTVAPAGALIVRYQHQFGPAILGIHVAAAMARDGSFLSQVPTRLVPSEDFRFVFQAGLGVVFR